MAADTFMAREEEEEEEEEQDIPLTFLENTTRVSMILSDDHVGSKFLQLGRVESVYRELPLTVCHHRHLPHQLEQVERPVRLDACGRR